jgi:hypothetical protein
MAAKKLFSPFYRKLLLHPPKFPIVVGTSQAKGIFNERIKNEYS